MPFAAALSTSPDTSAAVAEACQEAKTSLGGKPNLAVVFFSADHGGQADELASGLQSALEPDCLVGCQGQAILANDREVEEDAALVVWLARWTGPVRQTPFALTFEETSEGPSLLGWPDEIEQADAGTSVLLTLADPYTFPADEFLQRVNETAPGALVVGGMSSGARAPGDGVMLLGDRVCRRGAVGVLLQGVPVVRTVVSQGCRPVGRHMVITKARDNLILELGGQPALVRLQELWNELSPEDQALIRQGLHVGRVVSEFREEFHRGDFLVRNAIGFDRGSGAIAITERVRVGQTVQFHVRDAATADEDLHEMLQIDMAAHNRRPAGA